MLEMWLNISINPNRFKAEIRVHHILDSRIKDAVVIETVVSVLVIIDSCIFEHVTLVRSQF